MEKEFVPYEESFELDQLGFDEPCLGYWNTDPYFGKPIFYMVIPFDHECCLPAPLYQQAFRWFRKKGYDVKVEKEFAEVYFGFWWTGVAWSLIESGTYEEAELTCLRKLIQIVKEK